MCSATGGGEGGRENDSVVCSATGGGEGGRENG